MIKIRIFLIAFFTLLFSPVFSQEKKVTALEVLQKTSDKYNKQSYITFNTKYNVYIDYKTTKPYEQYSGFVLKKNGITYFKIKNTEFASFKSSSIKISHDEKAAILEEGESKGQEAPFSLTSYLKGFKYKLTYSNDFYICELTPAGKISQIMMQKVIIYIKKSDYTIAKQVLYLSENMESNDANGKIISTIPRIEIIFSSRIKNEKADDILVNKDNYFTKKNNKIVLSKRLSTYKLF